MRIEEAASRRGGRRRWPGRDGEVQDRAPGAWRAVAAFVGALALGLGGLAACSDDDGGPGADGALPDGGEDGGVPVCGNGVQEAGEACDGSDLDFQECQDLVPGTVGDLACGPGCEFETSGCYVPSCGDGVIDPGEQCDGTALAGASCASLGHSGGLLGCSATCAFDEGGCVSCGAEETLCGAVCADPRVDPAHCGGCGQPCGGGEICVAGGCVDPATPWDLLGGAAVDEGNGAVAHDLVDTAGSPVVAFVTAGMATRRVEVRGYDQGAWDTLGPGPSGAATQVHEAVALAAAGGTPYVLWSGGDGVGPQNVHVAAWSGLGWDELGAPGFASACMMHMALDLALEGTQPHVTTFGAGGCGLGVDYATWTGTLWRTHQSQTGFPAQLTMNGAGWPGIVVTDRPYVGVADRDLLGSETGHSLRYWETGAMAWATLDASFDENPAEGFDEDLVVAADEDGTLHVAWAEGDGGQPPTYDVYVKRWDAGAGAWRLLGAGPVSPQPGAAHPSLAVVDGVPWVACVTTGVPREARVWRYDEVSGGWLAVGGALNQGGATDADRPVIAGVAGVPHVAFRQGPPPGQSLYVVALPVP